MRFSTKYQDGESGFLHYGYRHYNPSTGRWPNRDPSGERRAGSVYEFVINTPVNSYDILGLWSPKAHRLIMRHALGHVLKPKYLKILQEANVGVDGVEEEGDYKHAMRELGQPPEEALEAMQAWLPTLLSQAQMHAQAGHCDVALTLLGRALHTMNDSDSPVHTIHNEDGSGPYTPVEWTHKPEDQARHSPRDNKGKETSKHIREHDWAHQDADARTAFESVFQDPRPCRRLMVEGNGVGSTQLTHEVSAEEP
jgi:RHS repeat-associated protein